MKKLVIRVGPILACLALMAFAGSAAKASVVDFACGTATLGVLPCAGSVSVSGSVYSSTGIDGVVQTSAEPAAFTDVPKFTLVFSADSASKTGTISLTGDALTGVTGLVLSGVITNVGVTTGVDTQVSMNVSWTVLPPAYQTALGGPTGVDISSVVDLTLTGAVQQATIDIQPAPEPASMLLFGSGLLGLGSFLRRRFRA